MNRNMKQTIFEQAYDQVYRHDCPEPITKEGGRVFSSFAMKVHDPIAHLVRPIKDDVEAKLYGRT